jgi:hypothetical protein
MLSTRFTDLRFIIGLFFGSLAVILVGAFAFGPSDLVADIHVNLLVGCAMGLFAAVMLGWSFVRPMS